jgi:hypothetical protein
MIFTCTHTCRHPNLEQAWGPKHMEPRLSTSQLLTLLCGGQATVVYGCRCGETKHVLVELHVRDGRPHLVVPELKDEYDDAGVL